MNKLSSAKRTQVVTALIEGCSINSTCRMMGVSQKTVLSLIETVGTACAEFQDRWLRDLPTTRVQVDEIWSVCRMKQKNVPADTRGVLGYGDVWTFVAIDADSTL